MAHNRVYRGCFFLAWLAVWWFSVPCLAQDARYIQELSPPLAVTIVPALVAQKPGNQFPYDHYETVRAEATRAYRQPGYNVSYYFVTYRLNNGQSMSGWTYQENATPIAFVSPWLAETVVQKAYIAKKPSFVTLRGNYNAPAGSRYRVIGTWQEPRHVWYLLQDENTDFLHGWTVSANIRQAGFLRQVAEQRHQEQRRQEDSRNSMIVMVYLLVVLYVAFGVIASRNDVYRGLCAEKLSGKRLGVLSAMPISSGFFLFFLLIVLLGGLHEGAMGTAIFCAVIGARAAFYAPASLMDLAEYARVLWTQHPAEVQVKQMLKERGIPSAERLRGIRRAMSDICDIPSMWESRYRKRRIDELKKLVESENHLLREFEAYLRSKGKLEK